MNFEIEKKEFLKGLSLIQGIAGRKTTLPILTHVLLECKNEGVCVTGTDLDIGIREELNARAIHAEGKASVSAKKLYEIVKELPDELIRVDKKENQWIRLQCGKSIFNLSGLDPEEFPALPGYQGDSFSLVSASLLSEMIEKTVFAASNEESRYHLNGILILENKQTGKQRLRMVATDGHRLSLIERESEKVRGIEKGVIVPKKAVLEIRRVLSDRDGDVGVYFDATHGFLKIGRSLIVVRLIDGEFPEYEQVLPKENDKKLCLNKTEVYACLRRVSTMTTDRGEGIRLAIKDRLIEFSTFNQDFGDAHEEVEVNYEGPPLEVGFNSRYLMDALNVMSSPEVVIELKDEGSPGIIKPAPGESMDQFCIIMPMRI
jgi:DNA polymerase III subunit beta